MKLRFLTIVVLTCAVVGAATAAIVEPMYLSNRSLGGADLNQYTSGVVGGVGPNNIGLLVKTSGKVTWVDTTAKYFYVDDGSGLSDGTTRTDNNNLVLGVRVSYGGLASGVPDIIPPSENDYAVVTGIISVVTISGQIRPNLRVRGGSDIQTFH